MKVESNKVYCLQNIDKINEQRKQYRETNKEKLAENDKEYYEKNKEIIAERKKMYYEKNQEAINQKQAEKITCLLCGCILRRGDITRHQRTKKCQTLSECQAS